MPSFVFFVFLLSVVWFTEARWPSHLVTVSQNQEPAVIAQPLNHFDALDDTTFNQRFWADKTYFDTTVAVPVGIVYICGEGPCGGVPQDPITTLYAKSLGAIVLALEHRYYGQSVPFGGNLPNENLRFLSSRQALEDLVFFKNFYQHSIGIETMKWIIIGGSYSGALSAWSRLKYPTEWAGALSSSGVVNCLYEFPEFDNQISVSAGPVCGEYLRNASQTITSLISDASTRTSTMTRFGGSAAASMTDGDFLMMMADTQVYPIQYGLGPNLCSYFGPGIDVVTSMSNAFTDIFEKVFHTGVKDYDASTLKIPNNYAERMWWWQKCSEMAYFQIAPNPSISIRSTKVNLQWHLERCSDVFGINNVEELVYETNIHYGALKILNQTTNIFYTDGSQDPWQRATVTGPNGGADGVVTNKVFTVHCSNCGHCVDIEGGGCPGGCKPPTEYNEVLPLILKTMKSWLA